MPLGLSASLGLGAPRSATSSGSVPAASDYDEDAQTYFTALDDTGFTPPADYDDKKTAISTYFTALKEDPHNNFTDVKAMYLPIWRVAAPNAINVVNPGTYDLTWSSSGVVQAPDPVGDYIYSNGTTGWATTGFHGCASSNAKFFEIGSTSGGCNVVNAPNTINAKRFYGWYGWFQLNPRAWTDACQLYWWNGANYPPTDTTRKDGLWTTNSITPDEGDTNKAQIWRDGSSLGVTASKTGTGTNGGADAVPMGLMGAAHLDGNVYQLTVVQFNFFFFGTQISNMDDFNTDTAAMLDAI